MLPRPMIAAWNTFVLRGKTRRAVAGMAPMYRRILSAHRGAPIVYVSTGAWNTTSTLTRFLLNTLIRHEKPRLRVSEDDANAVGIPGGSRDGVDRLYAKAMSLGATDEGAPGERTPDFYGAYVRDPDGNKICFFDRTPA